jgi:hypothetical protein
MGPPSADLLRLKSLAQRNDLCVQLYMVYLGRYKE